MAEPPTSPAPGGAQHRGPLATHPLTSLLIAVLLAAAIACTLVVPIYARVTPRVGDFPFFYFYLLAYMPLVAIALWVAARLQRRISNERAGK